MTREMLINAAQDEECRIAVVENNQLEELYMERTGVASRVGNIYKGKVTNVEPSIQACFVDFGVGQNGFLHISDLQSTHFQAFKSPKERVGRKHPRRTRPPIQDCLKRGQELIVQVIKDGMGTKGPTLTTYLSIPGRFLVLMPGMNRMGVSRKIADETARMHMRDLMKQLDPPKNLGFIIRTAGEDRNKSELKRDLNYLLRLWKTIEKRMKKEAAPSELYRESDLVTRTIRDVFNTSVNRIVCDSESTVKKVRDFLRIALPRTRSRVILHEGPKPLFEKYDLEQEIKKIHSRSVQLKSGGSLIIEPTEAMVAIDVNSGKYRKHGDAETTAFKINMEAAPEIARQLRLRDLGGVIIIDFIDMLQEKHQREVEKQLRQVVSADRARTKILRISQFGIVEMTRQRMRPSLNRSTYMDCPSCQGSGRIKSPESASIEIMRRIQAGFDLEKAASVEIEVSPEVAHFLQNRKRAALADLEHKKEIAILIKAQDNLANEAFNFVIRDLRGSVISCER